MPRLSVDRYGLMKCHLSISSLRNGIPLCIEHTKYCSLWHFVGFEYLTSETNLHAAEKPTLSLSWLMIWALRFRCYNSERKFQRPIWMRWRKQIRFNDAHSPSSVCTPTRYVLPVICLTYATKERCVGAHSRSLINPVARRLLAFKIAGYQTAWKVA